MLSWNNLPIEVKILSSVNVFKSNLEIFKSKTKALGECCPWNFGQISDEVLNRIEGENYLENEIWHKNFIKDNPTVAKKKFVNICQNLYIELFDISKVVWYFMRVGVIRIKIREGWKLLKRVYSAKSQGGCFDSGNLEVLL